MMNHRPTLAILLLLVAAAAFFGLSSPARADDVPVVVRAIPQFPAIGQGGTLVIAVEMAHNEHYHTWPAKEVKLPDSIDEFAIRTEIGLPNDKNDKPILPAFIARIESVQYPATKPGKVADPTAAKPTVEVPLYSGRAVSYIRLSVKPDAPLGAASMTVRVSYQSCNEQTCTPPQDEMVTIAVKIVAAGTSDLGAANEPGLFAGISTVTTQFPTVSPVPVAAASDSWTFDFLGWKFTVGKSAYWVILPIAFIAGFLLNLTPCVLPVIPIKVLSLQQQADNPAKLALFGTVYCIGIVATFLVLGLLIFGLLSGGQKQDWGQIFTNPWFTGIMAAIVGVMGLGMVGLFTIRLPQAIYMINPSHDTVVGNFLLGVLTAILSTPCTGPLLGATVAWSATQSPWVGLVTFVVMGIGMASPYAALIAFPKLIAKMPRAGPGGELLKQVLGLLMLAVAAFLAGNLTSSEWTWYLVGALSCIAWLWAIIGGWRKLRSQGAKVAVTLFALLAITGSVYGTALLVEASPIPWNVLREQPDDAIRKAIKDARAQGKVVVIDFTAKWCTNCHFIEKSTLNSKQGRQILQSSGVAPIKVDLGNSREGNGWGVVHDIAGGGGIPLIAVFGPATDKPIYFQSFFPVSDLENAVRTQGGK